MIRRGEGGEERLGAAFIAFMVARVLFPWLPAWRNTIASPARATIKALPSPLHRPRPYGW